MLISRSLILFDSIQKVFQNVGDASRADLNKGVSQRSIMQNPMWKPPAEIRSVDPDRSRNPYVTGRLHGQVPAGSVGNAVPRGCVSLCDCCPQLEGKFHGVPAGCPAVAHFRMRKHRPLLDSLHIRGQSDGKSLSHAKVNVVEYPRVLNRFANATLMETAVSPDDARELVLVSLLQRALTAFQAGAIVAEHGMPSETQILLRALLEIMFKVVAISKDPDVAALYINEAVHNRIGKLGFNRSTQQVG